jgi:hypothetical protein
MVRDGAQPCAKSGSRECAGGSSRTIADGPSRTIPAHSPSPFARPRANSARATRTVGATEWIAGRKLLRRTGGYWEQRRGIDLEARGPSHRTMRAGRDILCAAALAVLNSIGTLATVTVLFPTLQGGKDPSAASPAGPMPTST